MTNEFNLLFTFNYLAITRPQNLAIAFFYQKSSKEVMLRRVLYSIAHYLMSEVQITTIAMEV